MSLLSRPKIVLKLDDSQHAGSLYELAYVLPMLMLLLMADSDA